MHEHNVGNGTTGCCVLCRIVLPAVEGDLRRAVSVLGQDPSEGGQPLATKFEDNIVLTNLGVNPSVHAGCDQK